MGYSIGVVNGAALAFGRLGEALAHWRRLDGRALRPRPRFKPFSLLSSDALRSFFDHARDDAAAKAALKIDLTVVSVHAAEGAVINARFTPGGRGGWDAPFVEHAAASCAIPAIFPPVDVVYRGRRMRLYDGGVPVRAPLDFAPLARCADVLVLEMVRADELGRRALAPWSAIDRSARAAGRRITDAGLEALMPSARRPPRVFRLAPSRRLAPMMLDFRAKGLAAMLRQGAEDARAFLAAPARFLAS
jgi:predicted acylesterase/phospholipase RssA